MFIAGEDLCYKNTDEGATQMQVRRLSHISCPWRDHPPCPQLFNIIPISSFTLSHRWWLLLQKCLRHLFSTARELGPHILPGPQDNNLFATTVFPPKNITFIWSSIDSKTAISSDVSTRQSSISSTRPYNFLQSSLHRLLWVHIPHHSSGYT